MRLGCVLAFAMPHCPLAAPVSTRLPTPSPPCLPVCSWLPSALGPGKATMFACGSHCAGHILEALHSPTTRTARDTAMCTSPHCPERCPGQWQQGIRFYRLPHGSQCVQDTFSKAYYGLDARMLGRRQLDFPVKRCCESETCLCANKQRHALVTYIRTDAYLPLLKVRGAALCCAVPSAQGETCRNLKRPAGGVE